MIQIWHDKQPMFGITKTVRKFPDDYELVATVDTNDLEEAFELTNSIDCAWYEGTNIKLKVIKNTRSTSVGDIAVLNGETYYCDMVGWKRWRKQDET